MPQSPRTHPKAISADLILGIVTLVSPRNSTAVCSPDGRKQLAGRTNPDVWRKDISSSARFLHVESLQVRLSTSKVFPRRLKRRTDPRQLSWEVPSSTGPKCSPHLAASLGPISSMRAQSSGPRGRKFFTISTFCRSCSKVCTPKFAE